MAMTEEQMAKGESEVENMFIAAERAYEKMMELINQDMAVPAVQAFVEIQVKQLKESPGILMAHAIDPDALMKIMMSIMHSFLAGVEWGKANRDFYMLPADNACDDPSHDHYVPPKEDKE